MRSRRQDRSKSKRFKGLKTAGWRLLFPTGIRFCNGAIVRWSMYRVSDFFSEIRSLDLLLPAATQRPQEWNRICKIYPRQRFPDGLPVAKSFNFDMRKASLAEAKSVSGRVNSKLSMKCSASLSFTIIEASTFGKTFIPWNVRSV
jgi:hypothetical protein